MAASVGTPLTWRVLSPENRREYSNLIDQAFGLEAPKSYLKDFPVWDPEIVPAPHRHQVGGFHGTRLVCTASIRIANYRFSDGIITCFGLIGAVATHPNFTSKGYASEAIALVIHEGDRRNVNVFALWGSESPIYRKRMFEFGGKQLRIPLKALVLRKPSIEGFEFRSGWDAEIAIHLLARKSGLQYEDADLLWLSRHPNVEWRTLRVDGKCLAYCAWNRGIDLPNIIHELDGEPTACVALLKLLQDRYPDLEWITHPDIPARWKITGAENGIIEPLAQFRLGTLERERIDTVWFTGMDSC